jgi:hypothetical protein
VSGKRTALERFPEVIATAEMIGETTEFVFAEVRSC